MGMNIFSNQMKEQGKDDVNEKIEAKPRKKQPSPNPPDYHDPAYSHVFVVLHIVEIEGAVLTSAKDGGVDWDHVMKAASGDEKTGLTYALQMLLYYQKAYKPFKSRPSQELMEIISLSVKVSALGLRLWSPLSHLDA